MSSKRTLNLFVGKDTFAIAHSSSGLTHSYTINVAISMAAKLGQKLYIYFQDPERKFGKIIQKNIVEAIQDFNLKNIFYQSQHKQ
jgi:hypothetical protein